jgi:hypothetical protein
VVLQRVFARGKVTTAGGDLVDIYGMNFPYPTMNNPINPILYFPRAISLAPTLREPSEHLRLDFRASALSAQVTCLSSALSYEGFAPDGIRQCVPQMIMAQSSFPPTGAIYYPFNSSELNTLDSLTFKTPPGIGVNKTITVNMVIDGVEVSSSAAITFSYDPPSITRVEPKPLYDDGTGKKLINLHGYNFGRISDSSFYSFEESFIEVMVASQSCENAQRTNQDGEDMVQCRIPAGTPVGYNNLSIAIAGQRSFVGNRQGNSFFLVCKEGYFGHVGENCQACPQGAVCKGFVEDLNLGINTTTTVPSSPDEVVEIDITDGPVMVNDVMYDLRGFHTYPVPMSGFFNLNGTMAAACPPKIRAKSSERDLCIVGCIPNYACIGSNLCDGAYQSKAPYFRCADCAKGYYKQAGDCVKCPDSPAMVFIGFGMLILFVSSMGYFLNKYDFDIRITSIGVDYFQVIAMFQNAKIAWPAIIKVGFEPAGTPLYGWCKCSHGVI